MPVPSATVASATGIDVSWTNTLTGVDYWKARVYSDTTGEIWSGQITGTSIGITGLVPGEEYVVKVQAFSDKPYCGLHESALSNRADPNPVTPAPTIDGDPSATADDTPRITISWSAPSCGNVDYYKIYYSWSENGNYYQLTGGTSTTTSYVDTTVDYGDTKYYKVSVVYTSGTESALSNACWDTVPNPPPPSAPQNLHCEGAPTQSSITIDWYAPSSAPGGVDYYKVYRGGSYIGSTSSTIYTDSGRSAGSYYDYKVRAVDNYGQSGSYSATVGIWTAPPTPSAPTYSNVEQTSVKVNWVMHGSATSAQVQMDGSTVYTGYSASYTKTGLSPDTQYGFRVREQSADGGWSSWSSYSYVTTDPDGGGDSYPTPNAVTGLDGDGDGFAFIDLDWNRPSNWDDLGNAYYKIWRDGNLLESSYTPPSPGSSVHTYQDCPPDPGATYTYKVQCFNQEGEGGQYDTCQATVGGGFNYQEE
ncbi:MAG: hypothetical protein GF308_16640 [Candidatus Heimdallarchaeota archaeon]|nr:hypothetical protein [Candidatus Heimdallarchaeota archaeon]